MLQQRINLFHYNIWRFERWTRYLVFGDRRVTTIESKDNDALDDIIPFAPATVDESMLPNYSGKHFTVLLFLVLLTVLNVFSFLFSLSVSKFWFWGMIVSATVAFLASLYLTPMPIKVSERNVLLDDFKTFESMSESKKRISGVITFLLVIGIWATFILSAGVYLSSPTVPE